MNGPADADERLVYDGLVFDVYRRPVRVAPDRIIEYETVRCPDAVRVYPVTGDGRLLMISELRPELGRRVLRVVSGRIEPGEAPLAAAGRELREELGVTGGRAECFATSRPMLKVEHTLHHVLVRDFEQGAAALEPGEDVAEHAVALDELEQLAWGGEVVEDAIAFNLLRLRRMLARESA